MLAKAPKGRSGHKTTAALADRVLPAREITAALDAVCWEAGAVSRGSVADPCDRDVRRKIGCLAWRARGTLGA
ncbi:hypothetical protein HII36_53535 [Nonomuraea sp. NN258]|uniref:hypothetical protein n=1 Tax=Nonomuraea antri TaxID=2730852 RepID=UPI00156A4EDC|nr:hypothetical protein [Nonomuraea antri]NRQ40576.1 hypothetical protein [Nonomuraea antri]